MYDRSVTQLSHSHSSVSEGIRELYRNNVWNHPTAKNVTSTSCTGKPTRGGDGAGQGGGRAER